VGCGSVKGVNSEMEVLAQSVTESEMKAKSIVVRLMVRGKLKRKRENQVSL